MLDKNVVIAKMRERGFTVYAHVGVSTIQFVSAHMYQREQQKVPLDPVINIFVNLETGEFRCIYNIPSSINTLNCPNCSPVMDDDQFDRMVSTFELHAKWMERLR